MSKVTIPIIVARDAGAAETKNLMKKASETLRDVVNIDAEALSANLSGLISGVGTVVSAAEAAAGALTLKEVQVGVEITAEGGVALIGTASVGATASITLTFQR